MYVLSHALALLATTGRTCVNHRSGNYVWWRNGGRVPPTLISSLHSPLTHTTNEAIVRCEAEILLQEVIQISEQIRRPVVLTSLIVTGCAVYYEPTTLENQVQQQQQSIRCPDLHMEQVEEVEDWHDSQEISVHCSVDWVDTDTVIALNNFPGISFSTYFTYLQAENNLAATFVGQVPRA